MYQQIIRERFERASPFLYQGKNWYPEANYWCLKLSKEYDVPIRLVAGLTALFSPLKSWEINKKLVEGYLECQECGTFSYQRTRATNLWSEVITHLDDERQDNYIMKTLNGKKVTSFYHNIVYPKSSDKVTIDTHIINVVHPGLNLTPKRYLCIEKSFQDVSKEVGLTPPQLQATLWVQQKNERNNYQRNCSV